MQVIRTAIARWRTPGPPKEYAKSERRSRIIRALYTIIVRFNGAIFLLGMLSLLLLPIPSSQLQKPAFFDENALMPGSLRNLFVGEHVQNMEAMTPTLVLAANSSAQIRTQIIEDLFRKQGLYTYRQQYVYSIGSKNIVGTNVYAIFKAPKSDGSESILLSAPWDCANDVKNINGLKLLFGFAAFQPTQFIWSRDFIYLVPGDSLFGTNAFLTMYHSHHQPSSNLAQFDQILARAGIIHQAINFEFPGTGDYSHLGIAIPGVNGLQPNADLITSAIRPAQWSGINVLMNNENISPYPSSNEEKYLRNAENLLKYIGLQSLGVPVHDHAFYARYRIEALTLVGINTDSRSQRFNMAKVARTTESTIRFLNNLIERLHHSFWFYWMTKVDRFTLLSVYIGPIALLIFAILFQALQLWIGPLNSKDYPSITIKKIKGKLYTYLQIHPTTMTPFSLKRRPFTLSLITLTIGHLLGYLVYTFVSTDREMMLALVLSIFFGFLISRYLKSFQNTVSERQDGSANHKIQWEDDWKILKCLLCYEFGLVMILLVAVNPALTLVLCLLGGPYLLYVHPTRSGVIDSLIQDAFALIASPMSIFAFYEILLKHTLHLQFNRKTYVDLFSFGTQLFPGDSIPVDWIRLMKIHHEFFDVFTWPVVSLVYCSIMFCALMLSVF